MKKVMPMNNLLKSSVFLMVAFSASLLNAQVVYKIINLGDIQVSARKDITIYANGRLMHNVPIINGWAPSIEESCMSDCSKLVVFNFAGQRKWDGSTIWESTNRQEHDLYNTKQRISPVKKAPYTEVQAPARSTQKKVSASKVEAVLPRREPTKVEPKSGSTLPESPFLRKPSDIQETEEFSPTYKNN